MARQVTASRGSILILTVWTLFFLAALAVAVGSYVSAGLLVARRAAADGYGRAAMNAGVQHMLAVLDADTNQWDGFSEDWGSGGDIKWEGLELGDAIYSVHHVSTGGVTNWGVIDEESRININKASRKLLEVLFSKIGGADAIQAASIAAAVIDWRDKDETITEGGAEGEYYAGLQPGYQCQNDSFGTVYELMLVRGMSVAIFDRISSAVTVSGTGKVNVNTADSVILNSVAQSVGADELDAAGVAAKIVAYRDSGGLFSEANAMAVAGAIKGSGMLSAGEELALMRMMSSMTLKGSCFRGVCSGFRASHEGVSAVEFVYSRSDGRILFWHEN